MIIAFSRNLLLKSTPMAQKGSALVVVTPRNLSGLAVIFLLLAAFFALLNGHKVKALRADAVLTRAPLAVKVNAATDQTTEGQEPGKTVGTADRAAKAEAALVEAEKERADLKGKLDASQQEIAVLRERAAGAGTNLNQAAPSTSASAADPQSGDLLSQVDDLRRQLDGAEKEKELLAEKLQEAQRPPPVKESSKVETRKKRETASVQRQGSSSHRAGVHGAVLAYNQAYNFVVLNLGARNGVEANSEMLVLRDGTLIGKIRISSVEPATAIGDILTNSLARGVQVQPGDSVIYAGTSP
jgi:hypothetical protein